MICTQSFWKNLISAPKLKFFQLSSLSQTSKTHIFIQIKIKKQNQNTLNKIKSMNFLDKQLSFNAPFFLQKIKSNLTKILQYQQPAYSKAKRICQLLNYFIKKLKNKSKIDEPLHFCVKALKMLVMISDYNKYGHQFGFIAQLVKRYQAFVHSEVEVNYQEVYRKIQIYEKSGYRKSLKLMPISARELSFKLSDQINNFLVGINKNEFALPNSQCVGCSQVFTADVPIKNFNPIFATIGQLNVKKISEKVILKRYIDGICNAGGGLLLIGVQRKQELLYPIGLKFKTQSQIRQTQNQIITAIRSIQPDCYYAIDKVHVMKDLNTKIGIEEKKVRQCFKIFLFPFEIKKMCYIQFQAKGYQKSFEVFKLDRFSSTEEIGLGQKFYINAHQKYYKKIQKMNSHQNISCFHALPYNFKPIHKQNQDQGKKLNDLDFKNKEQDSSSAQQCIQAEEDDPKFPYSKTSLLAVRSIKYDRHAKQFSRHLEKLKQKVALTRPFQNSFKNCSRSIWMLSHEAEQETIKNYLQGCQGSKQINPQYITLIPVHKNLEVDRNKLSQYNEQIFSNKFKLRFKENYRTENGFMIDKNHKQKSVVYFSFNDYGQAIYAYLIFEELNLRPFFVRQTASMKKQCKISSSVYKF